MVTAPASFIVPPIGVKVIHTEDGAALLDIRRGICLSLNAVGAEIWRLLLLKNSAESIAYHLAKKFDEKPDESLKDVQAFLHDLSKQGLLDNGNGGARTVRRSQMNWLGIALRRLFKNGRNGLRFIDLKLFVALALFDFARLGKNFAALVDFVANWGVSPGQAEPTVIDVICNAINTAAVWYPKHVLCLQRSLITTCLLRSYGVQAQMVIGAQKLPFKAHAWVEISGKPINENIDVQAIYSVWDRC
jgi:hypothetical protein